MKKLLIIASTFALLTGATATFADQSEEGMKNREMTREMHSMMLKMLDDQMAMMKMQESSMAAYRKMLQAMYDAEDKNQR